MEEWKNESARRCGRDLKDVGIYESLVEPFRESGFVTNKLGRGASP